MTTAVRNLLCTTFLASTLAACGGGGDGGSSPSGSSGASDVGIEKLNGTWGGSFDSGGGTIQSMVISIDASDKNAVKITDVTLDGNSAGLAGTVTKASESPRTFRFVLKDKNDPAGKPVNQGAFFVDSTAKYLVFLDEFLEFGVTQKGADGLPTTGFSQADVNASWSGDALTIASVSPSPDGSGFGNFTQKASSAKCDPAASGSPGGPSACNITVGSTQRNASSVTLEDANGGRWGGTYTETPASGAGTDNVFRMYLSPDKQYSGAVTCATSGSIPSCSFYSWKHM
ncbi:MAG: hypothetical protein ACJ8KA_06400 [Sulfurifustis sp.]